mgnify:CR=1 FL=1
MGVQWTKEQRKEDLKGGAEHGRFVDPGTEEGH